MFLIIANNMPGEKSTYIDPWLSFNEVRRDASGRYAIVANSRRGKPEPGKDKKPEGCIFCPESRGRLAEPYLDGQAKKEMKARGLYIIPNKFSVVSPPESVPDFYKDHGGGLPGLYEGRTIIGRHLVMIESPNHNPDPFSDSLETGKYYENLVWGYLQMLRALRAEGLAWGGLGKNRNGISKDGSIIHAGASQPHPHSQAVGLASEIIKGENGKRVVWSGGKYGEGESSIVYETEWALRSLPFKWLLNSIQNREGLEIPVDLTSLSGVYASRDKKNRKHLRGCDECLSSVAAEYSGIKI